MSTVYLKHTVTSSTDSSATLEDIGAELILHGALGVEEISDTQLVCFALKSDFEFAHYLKTSSLEVAASEEITEQNWLAECQQVLEPIVAGKVKIIPTMSSENLAPLPGNAFYLQPGLGFGTGHHATTQMVLELLQEPILMQNRPARVADVGTGSGILAIVAAQLFDCHVLANDLDPLALTNAASNINLNSSTERIELHEGPLTCEQGRFDLILANIYAEVLCEYHDIFEATLNSCSFLVVSGIMPSKQTLFEATYKNWQICKSMSRVQNEDSAWLAYLLQKNS